MKLHIRYSVVITKRCVHWHQVTYKNNTVSSNLYHRSTSSIKTEIEEITLLFWFCITSTLDDWLTIHLYFFNVSMVYHNNHVYPRFLPTTASWDIRVLIGLFDFPCSLSHWSNLSLQLFARCITWLTCFRVPNICIAILWARDNKTAACAESATYVLFEVGGTKVALHDGIAPQV